MQSLYSISSIQSPYTRLILSGPFHFRWVLTPLGFCIAVLDVRWDRTPGETRLVTVSTCPVCFVSGVVDVPILPSPSTRPPPNLCNSAKKYHKDLKLLASYYWNFLHFHGHKDNKQIKNLFQSDTDWDHTNQPVNGNELHQNISTVPLDPPFTKYHWL